jgi:hypothetical protein
MEGKFLSIGMMAGSVHEKYRILQKGCCETWIPTCEKVYLFCGKHHELNFECDMVNLAENKAEFIHFNDVEEDYDSATCKFWYGLAWMMENDPAEWYGVFGSDNYVRYDKLVETLSKFDSSLPLTVGGPTQYRTIKVNTIDVQVPFNIGGGGNYITHRGLEMLFDRWSGDRMNQARALIKEWNEISINSNRKDLIPACDVALGHYSWDLDIPMIGIRGFSPIDWLGHQYWAHNGCYFSYNIDSIIVCHYMSRILMNEYHHFLGFDKEKSAKRYVLSKYEEVSSTASDIWEHIPTLYRYAIGCNSIAEMGVRYPISTWPFLHSLERGGRLYCVDIEDIPSISGVINIGKTLGVKVTFLREDSAKVNLPEEVDLLFIDTWHVYGHLKRELNKHHSLVRKYIIMHDTTVDEFLGESIRMSYNIEKQVESSGYTIDEISRGLWPAIEEFLIDHPEWEIQMRYTNCNGLTILQRLDHPL